MVYNYLNELKDEQNINEIPVLQTYNDRYANMKEYMEIVVMNDNEDAKTLVLSIAPIVLRIEVDICMFTIGDPLNVSLFYIYF